MARRMDGERTKACVITRGVFFSFILLAAGRRSSHLSALQLQSGDPGSNSYSSKRFNFSGYNERVRSMNVRSFVLVSLRRYCWRQECHWSQGGEMCVGLDLHTID